MNRDTAVRLFVDAHVFDDKPQGTRTFIKEIYQLIAKMPGIRLYLGACDIEALAEFFPPGDSIVLIKYRSKSSLLRLLFDIPSIVRKYGIDYAHFQYMSPAWKNCKQVVTIHDVLFNDFPEEFSWWYRVSKRLLYGLSARRADVLTTVSEFSKVSIRRYLGTGSRPIHITHNGVSERFFLPFDRQRSAEYIRNKYGVENYILYVSRIEPRKNHLLVLRSWFEARLFEEGIPLVFLGHESLPVADLDAFLGALPEGIRKFVLVDSDVNDGDLLEMYRAASLFVYPSRAEGFGIPPLEAAALRIPVLCSNTSAMGDFSFFGANHIDPKDEDAFKARLVEVLHSPREEDELSRIAAIIRRDYSWESSAMKLYGLLASEEKNPNLAHS